MLPDGFAWQSIFGAGSGRDRDALACHLMQVARMDQRLDGTWNALLRLPQGHTKVRLCTSYETGRAGCEAWASRHQVQLRHIALVSELRWLSKQAWRGDAKTDAIRRLAEMGECLPDR